jgi:hypothetical protein
MPADVIYDQCWSVVEELRQGLKKRDVSLIAQSMGRLRAALAARTGSEGAPFDELSPLHLEQLDLLHGIVESLESALATRRIPAPNHRDRMRTAEYLLEHLAARRGLEFVLSN